MHALKILASIALLGFVTAALDARPDDTLRVGAAASSFEADDSMLIAGGIQPSTSHGQEGELRAVAVVLARAGDERLAIVACDVLMMSRALLDPVVDEIHAKTGISKSHVLINATHTHHAPSTVKVHNYSTDETFSRRVQRGIVDAVVKANAGLSPPGCKFVFHLTQAAVGQNSRQLLPDGKIYWIGPRDGFVRPTGPFDPELPVLAFRDPSDALKAVIFNHSTHTIGTTKPGARSPSFYGLAAQAIERDRGATVCFLQGASGSTHNLTLSNPEMTAKIETAVRQGIERAQERPVDRLAAIKRRFKFRVRTFDEDVEDRQVSSYCRKWVGSYADQVIPVFRAMRRDLATQQGQERETWVQAMVIGDVAIVGVPAEFFTKLGLDIKNRSPFRHTYIAELANDWIGYLPDRDAHELGGYQVWMGFQSYAEPGTGERVVDTVVDMLKELAQKK